MKTGKSDFSGGLTANNRVSFDNRSIMETIDGVFCDTGSLVSTGGISQKSEDTIEAATRIPYIFKNGNEKWFVTSDSDGYIRYTKISSSLSEWSNQDANLTGTLASMTSKMCRYGKSIILPTSTQLMRFEPAYVNTEPNKKMCIPLSIKDPGQYSSVRTKPYVSRSEPDAADITLIDDCESDWVAVKSGLPSGSDIIVSASNEQTKHGTYSTKVTLLKVPQQRTSSGNTYTDVVRHIFSSTIDLSDIDYILMWVYLDSGSDLMITKKINVYGKVFYKNINIPGTKGELVSSKLYCSGLKFNLLSSSASPSVPIKNGSFDIPALEPGWNMIIADLSDCSDTDLANVYGLSISTAPYWEETASNVQFYIDYIHGVESELMNEWELSIPFYEKKTMARAATKNKYQYRYCLAGASEKTTNYRPWIISNPSDASDMTEEFGQPYDIISVYCNPFKFQNDYGDYGNTIIVYRKMDIETQWRLVGYVSLVSQIHALTGTYTFTNGSNTVTVTDGDASEIHIGQPIGTTTIGYWYIDSIVDNGGGSLTITLSEQYIGTNYSGTANRVDPFTDTGGTVDGSPYQLLPDYLEFTHDYLEYGKYVINADDRLYVANLGNTSDNATKIAISSRYRPWYFPTTIDETSDPDDGTELGYFTQTGSEITGLAYWNGYKLVFLDSEFFTLSGNDWQSWQFVRQDCVGCLSNASIVSARECVIWLSADGFYSWNGGAATNISRYLVDTTLIDITEPHSAEYWNNKYVFYCIYNDAPSLLIFDILAQSWVIRSCPEMLGLASDMETGKLYGLQSSGYVVEIFTGDTEFDNGDTDDIQYIIRTQHIVLCPPTNEVRVYQVVLDVDATNDVDLVVTLNTLGNPNGSQSSVIRITTDASRYKVGFDSRGHTAQVELRYSGQSMPTIHFIGLETDEGLVR